MPPVGLSLAYFAVVRSPVPAQCSGESDCDLTSQREAVWASFWPPSLGGCQGGGIIPEIYQNYQNFDSFLDQLSSRKRKNIRKERQSLSDRGIEFQQLTAEAITPAHWDSFYQFYLSTIERKWGGAYLTEDFFHQIGKMMADRIL